MKTYIYPNELCGLVTAPSSKSFAIRQLILAALSDAPTMIHCDNICSDILAAIGCLKALGAKIVRRKCTIYVEPIEYPPKECVILNCGESGAVLRFMLPLVCALGCNAEIHMGRRLSERPITALTQALTAHGARIDFPAKRTIKVSGHLNGERFLVPADVSSQFASGLMLALAAKGGGEVYITSEINSSSYIEITLQCLKQYGLVLVRRGNAFFVSGKPHSPREIVCEGDWSSAAYWLCAGALGKKPISVAGLDLNSRQGDRRILDVLSKMGACVTTECGTVSVSGGELCPAVIDASDIPDLVPVLAVVCACAGGESRIYNVERLRSKESDRVQSVCRMINSLGGEAHYSDGAIVIKGGGLRGGFVRTYSDHRIVMSAAVASCVCCEPVTLDSFGAFKKSYLHFDEHFISCGGQYESV